MLSSICVTIQNRSESNRLDQIKQKGSPGKRTSWFLLKSRVIYFRVSKSVDGKAAQMGNHSLNIY